MTALQWLLAEGDAVSLSVALMLLVMSVATWVLILWKAWQMRRASADLPLALAAFWQAGSLAEAQTVLAGTDREVLLLPLVDAAVMAAAQEPVPPLPVESTAPNEAGASALATAPLGQTGHRLQRLTRHLRQALHAVVLRLQFGQVVLATVGATAPFVGLLGTVWGIYNALAGMASAGQITIERIAGPVGEALIMTAAGLAVAIPAVLAYNVYGRMVSRIEAELEGFAHDLRELLSASPDVPAAADAQLKPR